MHVDLSHDQRQIAAGARRFFAAEYPAEAVRRAWSDDGSRDDALWKQLGSLGFLGLTVPERFGGVGLGAVELAVVLEEAGRVALAEPLLETATAASVLAAHGTGPQRERWLPPIAAGEARATIQLDGQRLVVDADLADVLVVARPDAVHVVEARDVTSYRQLADDGARRLFTVEHAVSDSTATASGSAAARLMSDLAATGAAAYLVGLSARLLETTVEYVKERRQFGRPVGSFQAVKHALANVLVDIETVRPSVWSAAYLVSAADEHASQAASVAKYVASRAAARANDAALQCHGAIGFTWEHDLHLWLKRGKALEQAYGSQRQHSRLIARRLFEGEDVS